MGVDPGTAVALGVALAPATGGVDMCRAFKAAQPLSNPTNTSETSGANLRSRFIPFPVPGARALSAPSCVKLLPGAAGTEGQHRAHGVGDGAVGTPSSGVVVGAGVPVGGLVGVAVELAVGVGVNVAVGVRVEVGVSVGVAVRVGVRVGGNTGVAVCMASGGYNWSMAEYQSMPPVITNSVNRAPA